MKAVLRTAVIALGALFLAASLATGATLSSGGAKKKASHSSSKKSKPAASKAQRSGKKGKKTYASRRRWQRRGQQAIKDDRAREIQAALIRDHYLTGEPSGTWDARTKAAMAKYQEDHGWQSKRLPDSRALIQLGLGPNHEGLLNPESIASTHEPAAPPDNPTVSAPRQ